MTQELIKRLREEQENIIRYRQSLGADGDYLCQEAADMIESLERRLRTEEANKKEFERDWLEACDEIMKLRLAVTCREAELRAALGRAEAGERPSGEGK